MFKDFKIRSKQIFQTFQGFYTVKFEKQTYKVSTYRDKGCSIIKALTKNCLQITIDMAFSHHEQILGVFYNCRDLQIQRCLNFHHETKFGTFISDRSFTHYTSGMQKIRILEFDLCASRDPLILMIYLLAADCTSLQLIAADCC